MSEQDSIVGFVDRDLVREAGEYAVVEIGMRWLKVRAGFCLSGYSEVDLF